MLRTSRPIYKNDNIVSENNTHDINSNYALSAIVETKIFNEKRSVNTNDQLIYLERVTRKINTHTTMLAKISDKQKINCFSPELGVELFVLSGAISDQNGSYSTGCFVRNPSEVNNDFYTDEGCTVLFKIGKPNLLDSKRVVINSRDSTSKWSSAKDPGVFYFDLHHYADEAVKLYRIRPECWITLQDKRQGVEMFIYEGSITIDENQYEKGSWLRYPAGSKIKVLIKTGVGLYVKTRVFPAQLWYK